jgi:hypothetical protein
MSMILFELAVGACALLAMASILIGVLRCGISPMPSSPLASNAVLSLAQPLKEGPIYELGSGWGGLAIRLARANPERMVTGYELSMIPYLFSVLAGRWSGLKNIEFRRQDFLRQDLSDAAMVVCYLFPGGMAQLADKLEGQSMILVSNTFALPGTEPDQVLKIGDRHRTRIYQYRLCHPIST